MPIVPGVQQISTDVPGAAVRESGADPIAESLTRTGAVIQQGAMGLLEQITRSEAQQQAMSMKLDDQLESQKYQAQLLLTSKDGFIYGEDGAPVLNKDKTQRTVTQEYRDWANKRFEANQKRATSGLAQDLYRNEQGSFFTDQIGSVQGHEYKMRTAAIIQKMDADHQKRADELVSNPSMAPLEPLLQRLYNSTDAGAEAEISQTTRIGPDGQLMVGADPLLSQQRIQQNNARQVEATFDGAINLILENRVRQGDPLGRQKSIDDWRAALRGEDAMSVYRKAQGLPIAADMLDPNKKAAIDARLIQLAKVAEARDHSDFADQIKNTVAAHREGKGDLGSLIRLNETAKTLMSKGKMTPYEFAQMQGQIAGADAIFNVKQNRAFAWESPESMEATIAAESDRAWKAAQSNLTPEMLAGDNGRAVEEEIKGQMRAHKDQIISRRESDWTRFMISPDGPRELQDLAKQMDFTNPQTIKPAILDEFTRRNRSYYDHAHPYDKSSWRILSKSQADELSFALKNPRSGVDATLRTVKNLRASRNAYELMDDLVRDGNLPPPWGDVFMQTSDLALRGTIAAIKGQKPVMELLQGDTNGEVAFRQALNANDGWKKFSAGFLGKYNDQADAANRLVLEADSVVMHAVQEYIANGRQGSPQDYIDAVVKARVSRNVRSVNVNPVTSTFGPFSLRGGEGGVLNLPPYMQGSSTTYQIEDAQEIKIKDYLETDVLPYLKQKGAIPPPNVKGLTPFSEEFYAQVQGNARWQADQRGFSLMYKDRAAAKWVPVYRKDPRGKPIPFRVSIDEVMKAPHKPGTLEKIQKFMGAHAPSVPPLPKSGGASWSVKPDPKADMEAMIKAQQASQRK